MNGSVPAELRIWKCNFGRIINKVFDTKICVFVCVLREKQFIYSITVGNLSFDSVES